MSADSPMREQSYYYFQQEAPELLQDMEDTLFAMQENFSVQHMHALMRIAHTLKGASASLELSTIETVAHTLEDAFKALCHSGWEMTPPMLDLLFQGYDCLRQPLDAEFAGTSLDGQQCIDRTQDIVQQLQTAAGEAFRPDADILSSADLGFDMTKSMFEVGVAQRLQQLEHQIASQSATELTQSLQTHCSVLLGLAESLGLEGFGSIATTASAALEQYPDRALDIAQLALANFREGQAAVLAGDRTVGGQPSAAWQAIGQSQQLSTSPDSLSQATSHTEPAGSSDSNATSFPQPTEWLWKTTQTGSKSDNGSGESDRADSLLLDDSALDDLWESDAELSPTPHNGDIDPLGKSADAPTTTTPPEFDIATPSGVAATQQTSTDDLPNADSTTADENGSFSLLNGITSMFSRLGDRPNASEPISPTSVSSPATTNGNPQAPPPGNPSPQSGNTPPSTFALPDELPTSSARATSVRVQVERLDNLNYFLTELLSLHNRQLLENEQLREAVRVLTDRLSRHQQSLRQLQDWERPLESPYPAQSQQPELSGSVTPSLESKHGGEISTNAVDIPCPAESPTTAQFDPLELARYSKAREFLLDTVDDAIYLGEATEEIDLFAQAAAQSLERQRSLLTSHRNVLMDARMVPMATILDRLPRILKQLNTRYSKSVDLSTSGQQVLVEKAIVEQLYDPLLHLIRNAFDHGIEPSSDRNNAGKSSQGQIDIRCTRRGSQLLVGIRDDGSGIDPERIRQKALDNQAIPAQLLAAYSDRQLLDLLFQPGFSTTRDVSEISGRGVGLDVVRARMSDLQGQVTVTTELGRGTTFTLSIPLKQTLETLLLCQVGYKTYAFLADGIEQVLVPTPERLEQQEDGQAMMWGDGENACYIPIRPLAQVLPYTSPVPDPDTSPPGSISSLNPPAPTVLVLRSGDTLMGIAIDRAIAEQELVVRPLGTAIATPSYVCGGAVLADGRLALVVDGERLVTAIDTERSGSVRLETRAGARFTSTDMSDTSLPLPAQPTSTHRPTILVIDDSLTQRMTVATTLEKAGYAVNLARNGRDGLQRLQEGSVDVVLCDLEMPMMNGYEFLNQLKQTPAIANIPVVMLTSRSSEKHRMAAQELGAVGYLTKPCIDPILLSTVEELLTPQS